MRKDGKSQYQLKKEKLKNIKTILDDYLLFWKMLREGKELGPAAKTIDSIQVINQIWEIVKDE